MRWYVLSLCLLVSAVLLVLGTPRLVGSVLKAPAFATLQAVHRGERLRTEQLAKAVVHLRRAARWEESGKLRAEIGLLLLVQARQTRRGDPNRVGLAKQAAKALREGLLRAPVQPHAWTRLAEARMIETGPSSAAATALEQSLKTGAFVPVLTIRRLEFLLRNWAFLSQGARKDTGKQVRYAWRHGRERLIKLANRTPSRHLIGIALRPIPGAEAEFEARMGKPR